MISAHYPMTYANPNNWVILLVIMAITAVARQYFVLAHKKVNRPVILIGAAFATLICTIFTLKATLASLTLLDVLGRAANPARENGIGEGEFGAAMQQTFTDISSSFNLWLPIMAALLGLSAYFLIRDRARSRANY
jgi:uncharacterized membrane protein